MSVKVITAKISPTPSWHTRKGDKKILASEQYMLTMHLKKDGKDMFVAVTFKQSFTINGLSVPPKLRWFLPNWKDDDQLYNTAGAVHDWLYATKGNYGMCKRSECDEPPPNSPSMKSAVLAWRRLMPDSRRIPGIPP